MYKPEEGLAIYHAFDNRDFSDYPELKPYSYLVELIQWKLGLFIYTSSTTWKMEDFVDLVNTITKMSIPDMRSFDSGLFHIYHRGNRLDIFLKYLKTIICPHETDSFFDYLVSFDMIYEYGELRKAHYIKITQYNNLNTILDETFRTQLRFSHRFLCRIVAACLYYNQDIYDKSVVQEFHRNFDKYVEHLILNYDDLNKKTIYSYLRCNNVYTNYDKARMEELMYLFKNIERILDRIQNNTFEENYNKRPIK